MLISGPANSGGGALFARMYLNGNFPLTAFPSNYPGNLQGLPLCYQLDPAKIEQGFGVDVTVATNVGAESAMVSAGILGQKMVVGRDNKESLNKTWILVQIFGPCNRVLCGTGAAENDLVTLWIPVATDLAIGFKKTSMNFGRKLVGTFTFDGAPGAGDTITLGGDTGTAGSWVGGLAPKTDVAMTGDSLNPCDHGFLGITPKEFPTFPADMPTTVNCVRRGVIMCMGMNFATS